MNSRICPLYLEKMAIEMDFLQVIIFQSGKSYSCWKS